jgi:hypothetical protein
MQEQVDQNNDLVSSQDGASPVLREYVVYDSSSRRLVEGHPMENSP